MAFTKLSFKQTLLFAAVAFCSSFIQPECFKPAAAASSQFQEVPGLYEATDLITPIRGETQFQQLVSPGSNHSIYPISEQRTSLVQFYMATCPHCQGFEPYFKRFVDDIAPHWHRLVRVFVVNCVDDMNINVCWSESSDPYVPSIRWSSVPALLENILDTKNQSSLEARDLSWIHRKKIAKSRRDLLSLRHATLDFMRKQVQLMRVSSFEQIPLKWLALEPLKSEEMLLERTQQCMNLWRNHLKHPVIDNVIVFENDSFPSDDHYPSRTVAADWSNYTCHYNQLSNSPNRLLMVHYTDSPSLFHSASNSDSPSVVLMSFRTGENFKPALFDKQLLLPQNRIVDEPIDLLPESGLERTTNPLLMEEFGFLQNNHHYKRNNPSMKSILSGGNRPSDLLVRRRRDTTTSAADQLTYDDVNWVPPQLFPGEEHTRWRLNKIIRQKVVQLYGVALGDIIPSVGHEKGNPGQIIKSARNDIDPNSIIQPKEDDLTPVRLTDLYKVLAQIVHKNILYQKQLDGFQLMGSSCFLEQLTKHFPFQGSRAANHQSISRTFLKLLEDDQLSILDKDLVKMMDQNSHNHIDNSSIIIHDCSSHKHLLVDEAIKQALSSIKVLSSNLQEEQRKISKEYDVGLADENHFAWTYCKGSKDYLRGHTCGLWVLFHTLTVHEYLHNTENRTEPPRATDESIYEYRVNYEKNKLRANCDPKNPEPAFLNATTLELFVDEPRYTLANIINFVRYYLACTNCAAHFSCMVKSSVIDFEEPEPGDHLLWLWEAHNRVNLRTKHTNSEDPTRPKHIFPNYGACPECYVKKPEDLVTAGGNLDSVQFYRQPLIDFLVGRYRRAAILNNKIRIEDLWRKPVKTR